MSDAILVAHSIEIGATDCSLVVRDADFDRLVTIARAYNVAVHAREVRLHYCATRPLSCT